MSLYPWFFLNFELQIQQLISFFTSWIVFICYEISIVSTTFKCCICSNIFEKRISWTYKFNNWIFFSFHELLFSKILLQIQHLNDIEKNFNLFFYSCLFWNTNWIFSSFHELTFSKIILQTQHLNEYKQNIQSFSILHVFSELLTKHLNIFFLSWTAFFENNDEISIANTTFRFFLTFMSLLLDFELQIQQLNIFFPS